MNKKLMIIAGEASGDLHGSALVSSIKSIDGNIEIIGIGGTRMQNAGMELLYNIKDMAFLGFAEVVKHIPFIKKVQKNLIAKIEKENIREVVLIDYPGFNLNLAPKLKKLGVKVIYYISPQIWAWGQKRIEKIKKNVDKMIVLFPFEKDFYAKADVDVEYVGHPLVERIEEHKFLTKNELFEKLSLNKEKDVLLVMPGSRKQEIERIFSEVIKAAKKISDKYNLQTVVACSENIDKNLLENYSAGVNYCLAENLNYDLLKHSKFGIIKSGTSTVEAGYLQLPSIVVYKTGQLTYFIGRALIKVKNIAMANIIAGKTLFEELIQNDVNEKKVFFEADKILKDKNKYIKLKNDLAVIKEKLGNVGASKRAAEIIIAELNEA